MKNKRQTNSSMGLCIFLAQLNKFHTQSVINFNTAIGSLDPLFLFRDITGLPPSERHGREGDEPCGGYDVVGMEKGRLYKTDITSLWR